MLPHIACAGVHVYGRVQACTALCARSMYPQRDKAQPAWVCGGAQPARVHDEQVRDRSDFEEDGRGSAKIDTLARDLVTKHKGNFIISLIISHVYVIMFATTTTCKTTN